MDSHSEKQSQRFLQRFLLENPLLRSLPSDSPAVRNFILSLQTLHLRRGDTLYREGDEAHCFFIVRHGELHRFHREANGTERLIGIHGRGSIVGEVSFLAGERHGARAMAILDSQVVQIDAEHWHRLIEMEPEALTGLVRILSQRFHRSMDFTDHLIPARIHTLAYPDNPERGHRLARGLAQVLLSENNGPILLLGLETDSTGNGNYTFDEGTEDSRRLESHTSLLNRPVELFEWLRSRSRPFAGGYDYIDASPLMLLSPDAAKEVSHCIPALLGLMRKFYSLVLIHVGSHTGPPGPALTELYRNADLYVSARDAAMPAGPRWMEYRRVLASTITDFFERMVSVTEENRRTGKRTERSVDRTVPLKQNRIRLYLTENGELQGSSPGLRRLARKLSGTLRGLCFGGGGARAYAHAGILEVLEDQGMEFDGVSGTSMGAVIGAAYAAGISAREIQHLLRKHLPDSDAIMDKGLPLVSFFRGRRLNRVLLNVFGDLQFEDLQIPFYCTSTDLNSGSSVIFESGYVATALRASVSIPGIFPPVKLPPYSLVDGGILNNLPGDVLRQRGFSRIVGINVTPLEDDRSSQTTVDFSEGVEGIFDYFRKPPVLSIITRSIAVEGRELLRTRLGDFDFILNPDMSPFDLFDFDRHSEIFEVGRKEAESNFRDLEQALLRD